MEFEVSEGDNKCSFKMNDKGMVLLQFYWKGNPSKSKKGNLNMAWCSNTLFDKILKAYQDGGSAWIEEDENVPF